MLPEAATTTGNAMLRTAESGAASGAAGAARKGSALPSGPQEYGPRTSSTAGTRLAGTAAPLRPISATVQQQQQAQSGRAPAYTSGALGGLHVISTTTAAAADPSQPISPASSGHAPRALQPDHARAIPVQRHADITALAPMLQRQISQQARLSAAPHRQGVGAAAPTAATAAAAAPSQSRSGETTTPGSRMSARPGQATGLQLRHQGTAQQQQTAAGVPQSQGAAAASHHQQQRASGDLQLPPVDGARGGAKPAGTAGQAGGRPPTLTLVIPPEASGTLAAGTSTFTPSPSGPLGATPPSPGQRGAGAPHRGSSGFRNALAPSQQRAASAAVTRPSAGPQPSEVLGGRLRPTGAGQHHAPHAGGSASPSPTPQPPSQPPLQPTRSLQSPLGASSTTQHASSLAEPLGTSRQPLASQASAPCPTSAYAATPGSSTTPVHAPNPSGTSQASFRAQPLASNASAPCPASASSSAAVQPASAAPPHLLPPLSSGGHPLFARQVPGTPPAPSHPPSAGSHRRPHPTAQHLLRQQQQQQQQGAQPAPAPSAALPSGSRGLLRPEGVLTTPPVSLSELRDALISAAATGAASSAAGARHSPSPWPDMELPSQSTLHAAPADWPRMHAQTFGGPRIGTPLGAGSSSSGSGSSSAASSRPGTGNSLGPPPSSSASSRSSANTTSGDAFWRLHGLGLGMAGLGQPQLPLGPTSMQGMQLLGALPSVPPMSPVGLSSQPWWWQAPAQGYGPGSPYMPPASSGDVLAMPFPLEPSHAQQGGAGGSAGANGAGSQGQGRQARSSARGRSRQQPTSSQLQHQQQQQQQQQQHDMELLSIVGVNALQPYVPELPPAATRAARQRAPSARMALQRAASGSSQSSSCAAAATDWLMAPPAAGLSGYGAHGTLGQVAEGTQSMLDMLLARMGDHAATLAALRLGGLGLEREASGQGEEGEDDAGMLRQYGLGVSGLEGYGGGLGTSCSEGDLEGLVYEMLPGMGSEGMAIDEMGEEEEEEDGEEDEEVEEEEMGGGMGMEGVEYGHDPRYYHGSGAVEHPANGSAVSAVHYFLHDACGPGSLSLGGGNEPGCDTATAQGQWGVTSAGGSGSRSGSGGAYSHAHAHAHAHHRHHHHHHHHHHPQPYVLDTYPAQLPGLIESEPVYPQASLLSAAGLSMMHQTSRPSLSRMSDRERYVSGGGDADSGLDPHLSLQQLMAAHQAPSFALERYSPSAGQAGFGTFSFASTAAQQGMLSDLQLQRLSPMLSPYQTATAAQLTSSQSTMGLPPAPMHGQLHSPLHSAAAHHHHHSQLLRHLRSAAGGQSAGSMGSGTLGRQTPMRSARLQPLQQQQQQQQQQAPGLGLTGLSQHHAMAADPQYGLGLMGMQYGGSMAEAVQLRPSLQQWTQHAARMLLPHSMRDMADLLLGDGWRPGLADALPGTSYAGSGAGAHHGLGVTATRALQEQQLGGAQRAERRPVPPGGTAPQPGPRVFSKLQNVRATHSEEQPTKHISPSELLAGRHPPPHVRLLMGDLSMVSKLLASLPGVDPQSACVQATVAALAGQPVPVNLLSSVEPTPSGVISGTSSMWHSGN